MNELREFFFSKKLMEADCAWGLLTVSSTDVTESCSLIVLLDNDFTLSEEDIFSTMSTFRSVFADFSVYRGNCDCLRLFSTDVMVLIFSSGLALKPVLSWSFNYRICSPRELICILVVFSKRFCWLSSLAISMLTFICPDLA